MASVYSLIAAKSRFTVQAFSRGALSAFAHDPLIAIRDFTGELRFELDGGGSQLTIEIKAASLEVAGNVPEKDKTEVQRAMQEDVLESSKFPKIGYRSTTITAGKITEAWYRLQCTGELSLHGARNTLHLECQLRLMDDECQLSGAFGVSQAAYRIKEVSAAVGMIKLKDELKFNFDVVGKKQ